MLAGSRDGANPNASVEPLPRSPNESLDRLRARFAGVAPPIVVFNKSHSGSRLLANLLSSQAVFIGGDLNASADALSLLPLVEHLVTAYYPDYAPLWSASRWPAETEELALECFERHLAGYDGCSRWGWKLCETTYILPVIAAIFPQAKFIHLIRDGRDVAFSDHVAPVQPFWRKVYFNDDRIAEWRGLSLTNRGYDVASHIYNALHWINSVEVGRHYGAMLHDRYLEIRYEELCTDFARTSSRVLDFCDLPADEAALRQVEGEVSLASIGKFRKQPARKQRQAMRLIEPNLLSLGYLDRARPLEAGTRLRLAWSTLQRPFIRLLRARRRGVS
jgi:sulfotransferase family protein